MSEAEIVAKKSPYIMGIDLGTSNSAIAVYIKGRGEIIPIDGTKTLPSVFSVRNDGEILIGRQARNRALVDPDNTIASIKREMGSGWTKEFKAIPDKIYTPTDISGEIIHKLVTGAVDSGKFELKGEPAYAVVCIPANFSDDQKTATKTAGELANLEILYLLEEPVAAAIAYALDKERDQTILVYDLGGGTFDVSILKVDSTKSDREKFKILAKEGVPKLGGDDFDHKIMEIAGRKFLEESGVDIFDLKKDQGINKKSLRQAQQKLKDAAEKVKRELSETQAAMLLLPNLIKDESGMVHNLDVEITRDEFNAAIADLIEQSKATVDWALISSNLEIEDIDRIILVGGSTRVPLVKEMLTTMFDKEPYADTDPDTVIARGAAIFASTLNAPDPDLERDAEDMRGEIEVSNIVTHFLGIETKGGKFNCLIEKGLDISVEEPLTFSKEYTTPRDNMTELAIRIYQSDREVEVVRNDSVKCIGEFFLTRIPAKPRGEERIKVIFEIDQQNLLKVKATSSSSAQELEIKRS